MTGDHTLSTVVIKSIFTPPHPVCELW